MSHNLFQESEDHAKYLIDNERSYISEYIDQEEESMDSWFSLIVKEVGDLAREINNCRNNRTYIRYKAKSLQSIRSEAVQVAAISTEMVSKLSRILTKLEDKE